MDYVGIDLHKKESEICSMVADPNFAPMFATRSRKVKTDRRDARALAEPACWGVPPGASPLGRTAASAGAPDGARALVRTHTGYIALTRALLRWYGRRVPTGSAETFSRRVSRLA